MAGGGRGARNDLDSAGAYIPETAGPVTYKPHSDRGSGDLEGLVPELADALRSAGDGAAHLKVNGTGRATLVPEVAVSLNAERDGYDDGSDQTYVPEVSGTLNGGGHPGRMPTSNEGDLQQMVARPLLGTGRYHDDFETETFVPEVADPLTSSDNESKPARRQHDEWNMAAYALRSDAGRSGEARTPSPDAEGRVRLRDAGFNVQEEQAPTLDAAAPPTVGRAFRKRTAAHHADDSESWEEADVANTVAGHSTAAKETIVDVEYEVRRLTPLECERLQGFPDGHTADQADSPRYRQLGNAVPVPVIAWIGRRIAEVDRAR